MSHSPFSSRVTAMSAIAVDSSILRYRLEQTTAFIERLLDDYLPHAVAERRSEPRYELAIPAEVQQIQLIDDGCRPLGEPFVATTLNISAHGIGLRHTEDIDSTHFAVKLATKDGKELSLLVEVQWCVPDGEHYRIGGRFITRLTR